MFLGSGGFLGSCPARQVTFADRKSNHLWEGVGRAGESRDIHRGQSAGDLVVITGGSVVIECQQGHHSDPLLLAASAWAGSRRGR